MNATSEEAQPETPETTNTVGAAGMVYVQAGLVCVGIIAICALAIFGGENQATNIGLIITLVTSATLGLRAIQKVDAVHVSVNSRMTQLTDLMNSERIVSVKLAESEGEKAAIVARAEGVDAGVASVVDPGPPAVVKIAPPRKPTKK